MRERPKQADVPTGSRASVRRELVENEMYEQATRLFAQRGFAATTLQDIADAIGITRPALYYYVKSKDELLERLVVEITEGNASEIEMIATDASLDAVSKLERIAHLIVLSRAKEPTRFLLLSRSEAELPESLSLIHEKAKRDTLRNLVAVVNEGISGGIFRPVNARTAALAVMGICNWVAWWHHGGDVHSAEQTARDLSEFAVAMIAQPGGRTQEVSGPRAAIRMIREDLQYLESMLDGGNESV